MSSFLMVPPHVIFDNPFDKPLVFGFEVGSSDVNEVVMYADGVSGVFSGSKGDFMALKNNSFVVLQPKQDMSLTYGQVIFPSSNTHEVKAIGENTTTRIIPGSSIIGYHVSGSQPTIDCITFFFTGRSKPFFGNILRKSLNHFFRLNGQFYTANHGVDPTLFKMDAPQITGVLAAPMVSNGRESVGDAKPAGKVPVSGEKRAQPDAPSSAECPIVVDESADRKSANEQGRRVLARHSLPIQC